MGIQRELNRDESYGTIIGEPFDGAKFEQNGIRFGVKGNRISKLSEKERAAESAEAAAKKAAMDADAAKIAAVAAISAQDRAAATIAERNAPPKAKNEEMPDFASWVKADMINFAKNKFDVEISPAKTHAQIKAQLEGLF